jgi:hypothetical protein
MARATAMVEGAAHAAAAGAQSRGKKGESKQLLLAAAVLLLDDIVVGEGSLRHGKSWLLSPRRSRTLLCLVVLLVLVVALNACASEIRLTMGTYSAGQAENATKSYGSAISFFPPVLARFRTTDRSGTQITLLLAHANCYTNNLQMHSMI